MKKIISRYRFTIIISFLIIFLAGTPHAYNMFSYPYYENDEGVYMSQAWSLLTEGKLAPYTYWYDHAPAGWILIALWVKLTGGFFTFGTSVNSGRVLMLILHVLSAFFVYYLSKRITRSRVAGICAVVLFSFSPLSIYFQRRVLLDNIMIFWVLLSMVLLAGRERKLRHTILSGICFGIGVLTKENAIFFIPVMFYLIHTYTHSNHKSFAYIKWMGISFLIISLYFLYAALSNELLPSPGHVSLIGSTLLQLGRGDKKPIWDTTGEIYGNFLEWFSKDPILMFLGFVSLAVGIYKSATDKLLRGIVIAAVCFFIFLVRGGTVINFYIVPLIPFFAILISVFFFYITKKISLGDRWFYRTCMTGGILIFIYMGIKGRDSVYFYRNETQNQIDAINYIKTYLSPSSRIIIDNYGYVDLHEKRNQKDRVYPYADWFWKVQSDPDIRDKVYKNNYQNIEYIALSHEMMRQTKQDRNNDLLDKALDFSILMKDFKKDSTSYIDMPKYISTNGDWMSLYKILTPDGIMLTTSWRFYKNEFTQSYGKIVDPSSGKTTSEGQSYAMLRALFTDDPEVFKGVWNWTFDHLGYRQKDTLFSWSWGTQNGIETKLDSATATDADQDIALALLLASAKWNNPAYLESAKKIISDIWKYEIVRINGKYYVSSSANDQIRSEYAVNLSYFSPVAYQLFGEVDPDHPWNEVIRDGYQMIREVGAGGLYKNSNGLIPNWFYVSRDGQISSAVKDYGSDADFYGYDAFRLYFRVAWDYRWNNREEARVILDSVYPFFKSEWEKEKSFRSIYDLSGSPKSTWSSKSTDTGPLSVFTVINPPLAKEVYRELFEKSYNQEGYWNDPANYYDQNWAWFGSALYFSNLNKINL